MRNGTVYNLWSRWDYFRSRQMLTMQIVVKPTQPITSASCSPQKTRLGQLLAATSLQNTHNRPIGERYISEGN